MNNCYLSVGCPQLPNNKVATASQLTSAAWSHRIKAECDLACEAQTYFRSSLLERSDDRKYVCALQCDLLEPVCYRRQTPWLLSMKKCLQSLYHDHPNYKQKRRTDAIKVKHWGNLGQYFQKTAKIKIHWAIFSASHFADKVAFECVERCFSKVRFSLAF